MTRTQHCLLSYGIIASLSHIEDWLLWRHLDSRLLVQSPVLLGQMCVDFCTPGQLKGSEARGGQEEGLRGTRDYTRGTMDDERLAQRSAIRAARGICLLCGRMDYSCSSCFEGNYTGEDQQPFSPKVYVDARVRQWASQERAVISW